MEMRLAFKFTSWKPTQKEWMFAAQCIQPEEKKRIARFVFKRDAKSAMAGRLLLRKGISDALNIPYNQIKMARTDKGKPFLENATHGANFSFNLSHQGDYAVLATSGRHQIGVDVMPVEMTRPTLNKTVNEYLEMMKKEFTEQEYATMTSQNSDEQKLAVFYRYWCLKESYVKTLGIGIGFTLKRIDFHLKTATLRVGEVVTDTQVYVDGHLDCDWEFHETLLDSSHCVTVAFHHKDQKQNDPKECPLLFRVITFNELTDCAVPQSEPDLDYWQAFTKKPEKPERTS